MTFFLNTGGCFDVLVLSRFGFKELKKSYEKLVERRQREKIKLHLCFKYYILIRQTNEQFVFAIKSSWVILTF